MANNIINLIRQDHYAIWNGKTIGATIPVLIIIGGLLAPFSKIFGLAYVLMLVLFSTESFVIEEKYRAEKYIASLPVRRRDIVLARHLELIVSVVLYLVLAYSCNLVLQLMGRTEFQILPGYYAVVLIFVSLLSFIFPLYFKFGAINTRAVTTIMFLGGVFGFMIAAGKNPALIKKITNAMFPEDFLTALFLIGIAILLFVISIKISTAIYSKKDL